MTKTSYVLDAIKREMERKHFTMSDLAGVIGCPQSKLSKILNGQQKLSTEDLVDIARALHVNPIKFFEADTEDIKEMSDNTLTFREVFSAVYDNSSDPDALVPYIEVELPKTLAKNLRIEKVGREVEPYYRYKRIIRSRDNKQKLFAPNPHVLVSDKGGSATLGNRLTMGYWFTKDFSSVYLTIHYAAQAFATAGQRHRMNDESDMRIFFESVLSKIDIDLSDMENDSNEFDIRSAFKKGVILCKGYSLNNLPFEEILLDDLFRMYNTYCYLLDESSERIIDTYQYLWSENLKEIHISSDELIEASKPMSIDEILPAKPIKKTRLVVNHKNVALTREGYCCEIDSSHKTFISRKTGKPYMEVHQLVPVAEQITQAKNVDIRAVTDNLVCLCPLCHAQLEYGENAVREEMLMTLYMKHKDALKDAGVDISLIQLLKWYDID